jgi:hypothetical protein
MVPHKQVGVCHNVLEALYNQQLFRDKSVVENSFGNLKQMFWELLLKTNLNILFLPDIVIVCCCMLHNLIMNGKDEDTKTLMAQLEIKNDQPGGRMRVEELQVTSIDDEVK